MSISQKLESLETSKTIAKDILKEYNTKIRDLKRGEKRRIIEQKFYEANPYVPRDRDTPNISLIYNRNFGPGAVEILEAFANLNLPASLKSPTIRVTMGRTVYDIEGEDVTSVVLDSEHPKHPHKLIWTDKVETICDICGAEPPQFYSCKKCGYDECVKCYRRRVRLLGTPGVGGSRKTMRARKMV
jgi:hypothetical protein